MNIGIVNDMDLAIRAIAAALDASGEHRVLWSAANGPEALRLCRENTPDLVLMDLVMPGMNGVETTREIMLSCPTAILVVTASVSANCGLAFEAMGAGALDVIATPALASHAGRDAFLQKIAQIGTIIATPGESARIALPERNTGVAPVGADSASRLSAHDTPSWKPVVQDRQGARPPADALVAIGCSAGGPAALARILTALGPLGQAAVVIIQHIDIAFAEELARWLQAFGSEPLKLVAEGEAILAGQIYLAGKHGHLEVHRGPCLRYDSRLRGLAYQPSVDVFFTSVARHWQGRALGIVLTGMGRDGAAGLQSMRDAGCLTLAQNKASSALFGMPKAAAPFAAEILPLTAIAPRINRWIQTNP